MKFKKTVLTKIFLLFLCNLNFLSFINLNCHLAPPNNGQISEDELYRLEKMANEMLAQLSPEEREQAMAMAQQMEQELAQLPPEKLAEVEAALKQDVQYLLSDDSPYKQFAEPASAPTTEYEAPAESENQAVEETPETISSDQAVTEQPKKKSADPVKIQTIKLLLQNIIGNLDEILLKVQTLPRISDDRVHEKSWQTLRPEINQLKSILAIIAEKPVLIAQLLETKFSSLYNNLQKLGKELKDSSRKLQVLKKLDPIIDHLTKLELSQMRIECQKLIKEFVPEALSDFTLVGAKWQQADYNQQKNQAQKIQDQHNLRAKTHRSAPAPHKLAEQLELELTNLQDLIRESQLVMQIEKLAETKQAKPNNTRLRQLEADLIRINLGYERLLRTLISVVGKSYQLAPQLIELMRTKVSNNNSELNKIKRLVSSTLAAEFELAEQIKKQLLKLEAQANELNDKIVLLLPPTKTDKPSKTSKLNKLPEIRHTSSSTKIK